MKIIDQAVREPWPDAGPAQFPEQIHASLWGRDFDGGRVGGWDEHPVSPASRRQAYLRADLFGADRAAELTELIRLRNQNARLKAELAGARRLINEACARAAGSGDEPRP